jgi:hypothetical protein
MPLMAMSGGNIFGRNALWTWSLFVSLALGVIMGRQKTRPNQISLPPTLRVLHLHVKVFDMKVVGE